MALKVQNDETAPTEAPNVGRVGEGLQADGGGGERARRASGAGAHPRQSPDGSRPAAPTAEPPTRGQPEAEWHADLDGREPIESPDPNGARGGADSLQSSAHFLSEQPSNNSDSSDFSSAQCTVVSNSLHKAATKQLNVMGDASAQSQTSSGAPQRRCEGEEQHSKGSLEPADLLSGLSSAGWGCEQDKFKDDERWELAQSSQSSPTSQATCAHSGDDQQQLETTGGFYHSPDGVDAGQQIGKVRQSAGRGSVGRQSSNSQRFSTKLDDLESPNSSTERLRKLGPQKANKRAEAAEGEQINVAQDEPDEETWGEFEHIELPGQAEAAGKKSSNLNPKANRSHSEEKESELRASMSQKLADAIINEALREEKSPKERIARIEDRPKSEEFQKISTQDKHSAEEGSSEGLQTHSTTSSPGNINYQTTKSSSPSTTTTATYATAPLARLTSNSTTTVSAGSSIYESAKSSLPERKDSREATEEAADKSAASSMLSLSMAADEHPRALSRASQAESDTITPNTEELEELVGELEPSEAETARKGNLRAGSSRQQQEMGAELEEDEDQIDEEQLRRILTCKRLSEGCNRLHGANFIQRKNSLHMFEELPPLTEGETMKHMSYHASQTIEQLSQTSSGSSGSLRLTAAIRAQTKRSSQDGGDQTNSCSSSTSLERSPTNRRRSSSASQCSSVLSEGTRNLLNFDLSPDLAPDSSLAEANAISPTDYGRPASPEPSSFGCNNGSDPLDLLMRPMSRMSQRSDDQQEIPQEDDSNIHYQQDQQGNQQVMQQLLFSPDSTLGDSNDTDELFRAQPIMGIQQSYSETEQPNDMDSSQQQFSEHNEVELEVERLISDVSTVLVSGADRRRRQDGCYSSRNQSGGSKRPADDDEELQPDVATGSGPSGEASGSPRSSSRSSGQLKVAKSAEDSRPSSRAGGASSPAAGQQQLSALTRAGGANSTCSSSSSGSSGGPRSRAIGQARANDNQKDQLRLLNLVEFERKELNRASSRMANNKNRTEGGLIKPHDASQRGRATIAGPVGHQHSNGSSMCYCHKR